MFLDTHAAVFLHAGLLGEFTPDGRQLLETQPLYLSPTACLELQYLYEIGRLNFDAETILADLAADLGVRVLDRDWTGVVRKAMGFSWTRDPFDRLIAAQAAYEGQVLLTRDVTLLQNCPLARW